MKNEQKPLEFTDDSKIAQIILGMPFVLFGALGLLSVAADSSTVAGFEINFGAASSLEARVLNFFVNLSLVALGATVAFYRRRVAFDKSGDSIALETKVLFTLKRQVEKLSLFDTVVVEDWGEKYEISLVGKTKSVTVLKFGENESAAAERRAREIAAALNLQYRSNVRKIVLLDNAKRRG